MCFVVVVVVKDHQSRDFERMEGVAHGRGVVLLFVLWERKTPTNNPVVFAGRIFDEFRPLVLIWDKSWGRVKSVQRETGATKISHCREVSTQGDACCAKSRETELNFSFKVKGTKTHHHMIDEVACLDEKYEPLLSFVATTKKRRHSTFRVILLVLLNTPLPLSIERLIDLNGSFNIHTTIGSTIAPKTNPCSLKRQTLLLFPNQRFS